MASVRGVTGLTRWQASDLALSAGAEVTAWADKDAAHSLAKTGATGPTYRAAVVGGQPAVEFDANKALTTAWGNNTHDPRTIICVAKFATVAADPQFFVGSTRGYPGGVALGKADSWGSTTWGASVIGYEIVYSTTAPDTAWHVWTYEYDGANAAIYLDGTLTRTVAYAGGTNDGNVADFILGVYGSDYLRGGQIADVVVATRSLGATDRPLIHSAMQDTYGITVSDYVSAGPSEGTAADVLTCTDAASRARTTTRPATDTAAVADGATRTHGQARAIADVLALTDSTTRGRTAARSASTTASPTDSTARATTVAREATDTATQAEAATRTRATTRATVDVLALTDAADTGGGGPLARSAADTLTPTDQAVRASTRARPAGDTQALTDTASRARTTTRAVGETLTPADTATTHRQTSRTASDMTGLVDATGRTLTLLRAVADALALTELVTITRPDAPLSPAPPERTLSIQAEDRTLTIPAEDRTLTIGAP